MFGETEKEKLERKKKGNCNLARGKGKEKGVIGDAIRCEGIQAGTEDAKVMRGEDGVHHNNNHNL